MINIDNAASAVTERVLSVESPTVNTSLLRAKKVVVNYTNQKSFTLKNPKHLRSSFKGRVRIVWAEVETLVGNVTIESDKRVHIPIDNISSIQVFYPNGTVVSYSRESLK